MCLSMSVTICEPRPALSSKYGARTRATLNHEHIGIRVRQKELKLKQQIHLITSEGQSDVVPYQHITKKQQKAFQWLVD